MEAFKKKTYELMQNLGLEPMNEKACDKLWALASKTRTEEQIKDEIFDVCERLRITGMTLTTTAVVAKRFDEAFEARRCGEIDITYDGPDMGLVWHITIYPTKEAEALLDELQDEVEA